MGQDKEFFRGPHGGDVVMVSEDCENDDPGACANKTLTQGSELVGKVKCRCAPTWTPAKIPNVRWLDPGHAPSRVLDGAGAAYVSLQDRGPLGFTLAQTDPAKRPGFGRTINGKNVLDVNPAQYLELAQRVLAGDVGHVFAVVELDAALPGWHSVIAQCSAVDAKYWTHVGVYNGKAGAVARNGGNGGTVPYGHTPLALGTPYILEWSSNGGAYELRVNGVLQAITYYQQVFPVGSWWALTPAADRLFLGAAPLAGLPNNAAANMALGQVVIADTALPAATALKARDYLAAEYGVVLP